MQFSFCIEIFTCSGAICFKDDHSFTFATCQNQLSIYLEFIPGLYSIPLLFLGLHNVLFYRCILLNLTDP